VTQNTAAAPNAMRISVTCIFSDCLRLPFPYGQLLPAIFFFDAQMPAVNWRFQIASRRQRMTVKTWRKTSVLLRLGYFFVSVTSGACCRRSLYIQPTVTLLPCELRVACSEKNAPTEHVNEHNAGTLMHRNGLVTLYIYIYIYICIEPQSEVLLIDSHHRQEERTFSMDERIQWFCPQTYKSH
jgi:hypothetical protein